jgi:hypothetical protein
MGEQGAAAVVARDRARERLALDDAATTAWLLALPCAVLVALLVVALGTPLGRALLPTLRPSDVWPWEHAYLLPEPREQGGYLLALLLPCLLAGAVLWSVRERVRVPRHLPRGAAALARGALVALVVACLVGQQAMRYTWIGGPDIRDRIFTPATLIAGAGIALALLLALRGAGLRARFASALRDTPGRRAGALALATTATVLWLLHAVNSDSSIPWTAPGVFYNIPFTADDPFGVINGLTPFVDLSPGYASLWPLLTALPLALLGKTLLVFTLTMCALGALALLAIYGVLRRASGSPRAALLLYLPFLATTLFTVEGTQKYGYTIATYFAVFPLRYAGPLLLAWLTARRLERPARRPAWPLFAAAGLVLLNNANFGLPAFAASLVALAIREPLLRLLRDAAAGLLLAVLAVCAVTLARAGALPDLGQVAAYSRYFLGGYMSTPMRSLLGLPLIVFATYVAALVVAAVRVRRRELGVLTGMLAWSAIFGLGALAYFVAESGPQWLKANFGAWALALALLAVVVVRGLAATGARRPEAPQLAVLLGVGVMACSLAQLATPWSQIARLTAHHGGPPPGTLAADGYVPDLSMRPFVASLADGRAFYFEHGAPIALLVANGHRIADAYGVVNVSPYANLMNLIVPGDLRTVVARLRAAGGNTVVMATDEPASLDVYHALLRMGFGVVTQDGIARVTSPRVRPLTLQLRGEPIVKLVDLRTPHPRALRGERGILVERIRHAPW